MKYLVSYAYFERGEDPADEVDSFNNFKFFVYRGILDREDEDYVIVEKGGKITVPLPNYKNVQVIKQSPEGRDFAGYAHALENVDINKYDKFIFLNDTCCGPFLPRYISKDANWAELFSSRLSDKVKLVGPTRNETAWREPAPHIQSYAFATDKVGLKLLIEKEIFIIKNGQEHYHTFFSKQGRTEFIRRFEVGMSKVIMEQGYGIEPLVLCDLKGLNSGATYGDNQYHGITHNPLETIFIKSNLHHRRQEFRNTVVQKYREWMSN